MSFKFSLIGVFLSSDLFCKIIILTLLITSIWSWSAIIFKLQYFHRLNKELNIFEKYFWTSLSIAEFQKQTVNIGTNILLKIMNSGIKEYHHSIEKMVDIQAIRISTKERIYKAMDIVRNKKVEIIESQLALLATAGAITPFIGLLGTVWGIMNSFSAIAGSKNTSLAVVAPGISEALFATALGLFVAIPAVIFYNILSRKAELIVSRIDDFVLEFQNILSRSLDKDNKKSNI